MDSLCKELQQTWHEQIPMAAAMGVEIQSFANDELTVRAALQPNINVHGTAFAGSLYSICALTGWGMMWLQLRMRGMTGEIVLARAKINYSRPVSESIHARCHFDAERQNVRLLRLSENGKANVPLTCTISAAHGEAVSFEGMYAVRSPRR